MKMNRRRTKLMEDAFQCRIRDNSGETRNYVRFYPFDDFVVHAAQSIPFGCLPDRRIQQAA
jgi:hypothetical protein